MRTRIIWLLLLTLVSQAPPALTQSSRPAGQEEEVVRIRASEVALDAVVRDKKGRPVKDLQPSDFEVYEDGVRQQVTSFRLVTREATTVTAPESKETAAGPAPVTPGSAVTGRGLERIGAVALVFDRLSTEARRRARQGALSYVGGGLNADNFVGVFGIDQSLRVLQPFSNNEQFIRQGIDRATSLGSSSYTSSTGEIANLTQRQGQLASAADAMQANAGGANSQGAAGAIASNSIEQAFAEMTRRSLETFQTLERNQQGYATMNGLLAVINSLGRMPGRKVLILFSEGLAIPPDVESPFRSVISHANRAGVSIYAVDAAGLRATSSDMETARAMNALAQRRMEQAASSLDNSGPMLRDAERNEDLLRLSPNSGLGQLADQTGGLLISDTNNPGARLRQVDEDLHTYYALSFVPQNQNYDGRFRQISIKLHRPGLEVQTRKGYYAINADFASPVLAYEVPALALLSGNRRPDSFPIRAAAFSFPEPGRLGIVSVMVEVPPGSINFPVDQEKKGYRTDFSIVALVKDESQRVIAKLSNHYLLSGALDKLKAAQRGAILFSREAELPPGRYTVAAVVYDATTGHAATSSGSVVVPHADPTTPRLASVVIIKRAERLATGDQQSPTPFRFGEMIVYPNLGEPLRKSVIKELALLLTVYAPEGVKSPPKLTFEVAQGGRTLARATIDLPAPDATGRIQHASTIPMNQFKPGAYELKVTASSGQSNTTRTEHFTIQP